MTPLYIVELLGNEHSVWHTLVILFYWAHVPFISCLSLFICFLEFSFTFGVWDTNLQFTILGPFYILKDFSHRGSTTHPCGYFSKKNVHDHFKCLYAWESQHLAQTRQAMLYAIPSLVLIVDNKIVGDKNFHYFDTYFSNPCPIFVIIRIPFGLNRNNLDNR